MNLRSLTASSWCCNGQRAPLISVSYLIKCRSTEKNLRRSWYFHSVPCSLLSAAMPGISLRPYSVAVQSRTFRASEPDFLIWSGHFLPSCEEKQKHFLGSPVLTSSQDTQLPRNILAMPCVPVWCRIGPWCFLLQVLGHISRAQRMRSRCWQDQVGIWESEDMFGKGMLAHS